MREKQRSQRGCIARRMQPDFYNGLLVLAMLVHAAYDLVAGSRIAMEARQYDRDA